MKRLIIAWAALGVLGCSSTPVDPGADAGPSDAGPVDAGVDYQDCDAGILGPGTALATGLDVPRRLTLQGDSLFVSVAGAMTLSDGQLLEVPLKGGAPVVLAQGFRAPDALAADSQFVYLVDGDGLWRISRSSKTKEPIDATLTNHLFGDTEVRVAGQEVVVATGLRWLVRVRGDGSSRAVLHEGPPGSIVRGAVLEGDQVYFLLSGAPESGLFKVPLDGSSAAIRVSPEASSARSLAISAQAFVWTEGSAGAGRVLWLERGLSGPPLVLASGLLGPARAVVAGRFVYFKDASTSEGPGFFRRVSLCNPGQAIPVGPVGAGPGDLLFDGQRFFFTSAANTPQGLVGALP